MNREKERIMKRFKPDGNDIDGAYWILPNDRKTYDFNEWLREDEEYQKAIETYKGNKEYWEGRED